MVWSKGDSPVKKTEVARRKEKTNKRKLQVDTLDQEKHVPSMEK
jgi:hypothetical protein